MPATTTGAPFSLNVPSASSDLADLFGLYLVPNMATLNTNAAHKGAAQSFTALQTFSAGFSAATSGAKTATFTPNAITAIETSSTSAVVKTGLSISSTGTWNGASAVNRGLYVTATGGAANYAAVFDAGFVGVGTTTPTVALDVTGAIKASAGLTVSASGVTVTGNSTITGTLTGLTGLTVASGGATVTAGGLTVTAGGATINGGGITVNSTGGNVGIGGSPSYRLHLLGETDQYPTALYIAPSGHATSRRAGAAIDDWLLAQATAGNGTKDFGIYQGAAAAWRLLITTGGNVGINQTSPGSTLDVKGTLRLSGSSSGYVGLAPAAAAGSVTYTLPTADGSAGQVLQTNGAGTLAWATASGGGGGARAMLLMGA